MPARRLGKPTSCIRWSRQLLCFGCTLVLLHVTWWLPPSTSLDTVRPPVAVQVSPEEVGKLYDPAPAGLVLPQKPLVSPEEVDKLYDPAPAGLVLPEKPLALSNQCKGCDFVADMKCHYPWRKGSVQYYHRLMQCLLPHYGVLAKARQANGTRCFIGDKGVLLPFLSLLLGDEMPYRLIHDSTLCVKKLKTTHAILDASLAGMKENERFNVYNKFPVEVQLAQLQADVARHVLRKTHSDGFVIVLSRRGDMRNFLPASEVALVTALRSSLRRPVIKFRGSEGLASTMRLFATAAAVVGFHGAGLANSVFNGRRLCAVEISTYKDENCTDRTVWRSLNALFAKDHESAGRLTPLDFNPHVVWRQYFLPLRQLLAANYPEKRCGAGLNKDMDNFIKRFKNISLTSQNADEIAGIVEQCLAR